MSNQEARPPIPPPPVIIITTGGSADANQHQHQHQHRYHHHRYLPRPAPGGHLLPGAIPPDRAVESLPLPSSLPPASSSRHVTDYSNDDYTAQRLPHAPKLPLLPPAYDPCGNAAATMAAATLSSSISSSSDAAAASKARAQSSSSSIATTSVTDAGIKHAAVVLAADYDEDLGSEGHGHAAPSPATTTVNYSPGSHNAISVSTTSSPPPATRASQPPPTRAALVTLASTWTKSNTDATNDGGNNDNNSSSTGNATTISSSSSSMTTGAGEGRVPSSTPDISHGAADNNNNNNNNNGADEAGGAGADIGHHLPSNAQTQGSSNSNSAHPPTRIHFQERGHVHGRSHRHGHRHGHGHDALSARFRSQSRRIRIMKVRDQFEKTLLILLTLNVIYVYYIDHKLLVLIIRATQLFRLLWFPHSMSTTQRGTAILLLVSNIPILLIHKLLFSGPNISRNLGEMLFINFIGTEPKSLFKVLFVDVVTMTIQAILLQCRWDPVSIRILSDFPVPASEPLIPLEDDPFVSSRVVSAEVPAASSTSSSPDRHRHRHHRSHSHGREHDNSLEHGLEHGLEGEHEHDPDHEYVHEREREREQHNSSTRIEQTTNS